MDIKYIIILMYGRRNSLVVKLYLENEGVEAIDISSLN